MLSYSVINKIKFLKYRLSYDIRLALDTGLQPTKEEILEVAMSLWDNKYDKTFVCFYLPGMQVDAGAYATGHSGKEARIHGWPAGVNRR